MTLVYDATMRALGMSMILSAACIAAQDDWVSVPGTSSDRGFAWYRCVVHVPADWQGAPLHLQLGRIADCDETFFNGERVGATGGLPPEYASAREVARNYEIAAEHVRAGAPNLIAVRVYAGGDGGGFRDERLDLSGARGSMPLRGTWRVQRGDDAAWARWPAAAGADALVATFLGAAQRPGIPLLRRSPAFVLPPGGIATPADNVAQAMPVGTGELTVAVFGGIEREQLRLTDATGRVLADLLLSLPGADEIVDYARSLDLGEGIARVKFRGDGIDHQREVFASVARQVIVVHAAAAKAGAFSALVNLGNDDGGRTVTEGDDTMVLTGDAFAVVLSVLPQGGSVRAGKGVLRTQGDGAWFLITAASGVEDPRAVCLLRIEQARRQVTTLRAEHVAEHRTAFERVSLQLDADDGAAHAFALGRYLLALHPEVTEAEIVRQARDLARAGDGAGAYDLLRPLFSATTFDDVDARCGVATAIAEMLLQSRTDGVALLPALPAVWREGQVRGLQVGSFVVDIDWRGGELRRSVVVSTVGTRCTIDATCELDGSVDGEPLPVDRPGPGRLVFSATPGRRYELRPRQ